MNFANMRPLLWWEIIEHGDFQQYATDPFFYAACDSMGLTVQAAFNKHRESGRLVLFYRPVKEAGE
jgi:hypothetical protein